MFFRDPLADFGTFLAPGVGAETVFPLSTFQGLIRGAGLQLVGWLHELADRRALRVALEASGLVLGGKSFSTQRCFPS